MICHRCLKPMEKSEVTVWSRTRGELTFHWDCIREDDTIKTLRQGPLVP